MKSGIKEFVLDFGLSFLVFAMVTLIILLASVQAQDFIYVTF